MKTPSNEEYTKPIREAISEYRRLITTSSEEDAQAIAMTTYFLVFAALCGDNFSISDHSSHSAPIDKAVDRLEYFGFASRAGDLVMLSKKGVHLAVFIRDSLREV